MVSFRSKENESAMVDFQSLQFSAITWWIQHILNASFIDSVVLWSPSTICNINWEKVLMSNPILSRIYEVFIFIWMTQQHAWMRIVWGDIQVTKFILSLTLNSNRAKPKFFDAPQGHQCYSKSGPSINSINITWELDPLPQNYCTESYISIKNIL